jgi:hypothetical protein
MGPSQCLLNTWWNIAYCHRCYPHYKKEARTVSVSLECLKLLWPREIDPPCCGCDRPLYDRSKE